MYIMLSGTVRVNQSGGEEPKLIKNLKIQFFGLKWIPSLWASWGTQKFWWESLRLKINEDKPTLVIELCYKAKKNTFGHKSRKIGSSPMILCQNTQWVRGKFWPFINFYSLLVKILRNFEKTNDFLQKSRLLKKCVPHLLQTPKFSGANF